ncbi:Flp pilus assembly CpaF family ATPase [Bradyrhizobium sp. BR13661]|jgi:Flp pilus assembly CpaF family ATPase|nr:Flp pilus assembly CpaF family ATPase [Bradyrhizobium sp. BR13661]
MLRTALGSAIARFPDGPDVVEVMLNSDGRLWINRLSSGLADIGAMVSASDGERIVRLVLIGFQQDIFIMQLLEKVALA